MEIGGIIQQVEGLQFLWLGLVQPTHLPGGDLAHLQLIQQLPASVYRPHIDHFTGDIVLSVPFGGLEITLVLIGGGVGVGLQSEGQALVPEVAQFLQPVQHRHSGG